MLAAALSLTNCAKNEEFDITPEVKPSFELFANVDSRTTNDGMSTKWAAKDEINVFHAVAGTTAYVNDTPYSNNQGHPFVTADASGIFKGTAAISYLLQTRIQVTPTSVASLTRFRLRTATTVWLTSQARTIHSMA